MPGFKFNEPHFCWTVIISITWSQTQMNYRNPVCDSPTPCDGERHLEGNLGWILRDFLAEMLLRSSFEEQETNCRSWKVVFWIWAWAQSLRGFLSSTVHALENILRMLTLWTWEFSCCLGSLLRGKSGDRFRYFWCCILCSPHGPSMSHTHPASTSWEFLGNPAVISRVPIPGKPALNGTTTLLGHFPPLCPSLHPPSRIIHGKQGLTLPHNPGMFAPTQHHSQTHQIHHWVSLILKYFPASFPFAFPAPRQSSPAHIFPPALEWSMAGCSVTLQRSDK